MRRFLAIIALLASCFPSLSRREDDLTIWPNNVSRANSDPWIAEHHDSIRQIRPRVLVVNFSNEHSMATSSNS